MDDATRNAWRALVGDSPSRPEPEPVLPTGDPVLDEISGVEVVPPQEWRPTNSLLPSHTRHSVQTQRLHLRRRIAQLQLQGLNLQEIAAEVNLQPATVRDHIRAIQFSWTKSTVRDQDVLLQQELRRLDALMAAHWLVACDVDDRRYEASAKIVQRCLDARARLLGLNAEYRIRLQVDQKIEVASSPEFLQVAQLLMTQLADQPEIRLALATKLRELAAGNANTIEGEFRALPGGDGEEQDDE